MVLLTGKTLTMQEVKRVVFDMEEVELDKTSLQHVRENRSIVEQLIDEKNVIYGINTGFGNFSNIIIGAKDLDELQLNLIHSHACGVGDAFSEKISRAMLLLRANALLQGYSGVRPELLQQLVAFLNEGIHPIVPEQGSLGASGDLAPLSHLALGLLGEGEVFYQGHRMETKEALFDAGIKAIRLKPKEGLALINGTQAMTAVGAVLYLEMEKLLYQSELTAAMTFEGLQGIIDAFDEKLHNVRGHLEQMETAGRLRKYLTDSRLTTTQGELRVQDAYSLRCVPQVLGACWQTVNYAKEKLEIEMNAVTDNPLIFSEERKVISGGNFHGQPIAFAMDFIKLGIAETANISERRIERLVNPQLNDLPAFLSPNPGLESGAMIMQYSAASLVSENKTLAHPASVDSIPSSANQEDHVSMGTIAARHAYKMLENTRRVVGVELICALQACEIRGKEKMAPITREFYEKARQIVPSITKDRIFSIDMEKVTAWLRDAEESDLNKESGEEFHEKSNGKEGYSARM